jgi:hypothetical protein
MSDFDREEVDAAVEWADSVGLGRITPLPSKVLIVGVPGGDERIGRLFADQFIVSAKVTKVETTSTIWMGDPPSGD